jgi:RNA ligase (TIGR02306 family)
MINVSSSNSDDLFKKRKLASVQRISNLIPLGKKNLEELATVIGWKVIVPSNTFKINEKIIYFEIDSLLPMGKSWTSHIKSKNLRIKTIQKYNEISQGLIMKLDTLLKVENFKLKIEDLKEGFDLTEILEVTKYDENSEEALKEKEKRFPTELIEKSDEIRIQSNLHYIDIFFGKEFYSSLKFDGCSATYLIEPDTNNFRIFSRNCGVSENEKSLYSEIAEKYDIKNKLLIYGGIYAIQGEIYGPKINGNRLNVNEIKFVVFCMKNIIDNHYLDFDELVEMCEKMDLEMVDIVEEGIFKYKTVEELIEKSKGLYPGTNCPREGLVYRLKKDWNINGKRFSFKVINDDYLLLKSQ